MFVEFQRCRMDLASSRDPARPALNMVYMDLERQMMFAADGFCLVVKRFHIPLGSYEHKRIEELTDEERREFWREFVEDGIGETIIGIPPIAMQWLMGIRGQDVRLLLLRAGDHVLVSRDERQTVAITGDNLDVKFAKGISNVASEVLNREHLEQTVNMDLRKFRQIQLATGESYAAIAVAKESKKYAQKVYLVAQKDAAAIVMPVHMEGQKQVDDSLKLLREFVGPEEDKDEGTVQDA